MGNEIDLVVGSEAFAQITKLLVELGKVDSELTSLSTSFSNLGKGATSPQNTAELTKLTDNNAKLNAQILELTKSYDALNKKLSEGVQTAVAKSKYTTQETTDLRLVNKELGLQNVKASELAGAYEKLSAAHKIARGTAADLAAIQGTQSKEFLIAAANANAYDKKLKEIDQNLGQHGRHVGDYARSWNGLGNSVNQLTREAPAFANSLNTGFMALSNNIPILADEIGNLINKNKDLIAQGKPTESVFKSVATAFFSWQTLLSLGVTLLTVYGGKLYEMAFGLSEAQKAQNELNKSMIEAKSTVTADMILMKEYVTIINSTTESELNKKLAYDEVKKVLPGITSLTYEQAVSTGELTKATDLYILSLIKQKVVELESADIAKQQTELNKKKAMTVEERMGFWDNVIVKYTAQGVTMADMRRIQAKEDDDEQSRIDTKMQKLIKSTEEELSIKDKLSKYITDPSKANKDAKKAAEEAAKLEEERLVRKYEALLSNLQRQKEIDKDTLNSFKGTVEEKTKLSIRLAATEIDIANIVFEEKKRLAKGDVDLITVAVNDKKTAEENAGQENIKRVIKYYEDLSKLAEEYAKSTEFDFLGKDYRAKTDKKIKDDEDKIKKSAENIKNYLGSFADEFASKAGMTETFKMLSGDIAGFGKDAKVTFVAIAESAQEMFGLISEASDAGFQEEFARLDNQKTIAMQFAGESASAKAKVDEDYAKKKHEIELRQFKEKQKITVANIAIDTAQAIVSIWAQVPKFDFGISATALSVMVGAMGAVQAGIVLAQKPPAYAEGTDNHSGGLMLVNDGKGSNFEEKVILPSGKVIRPQGRNVLMYAPKGTKVLNHEQQLFEMLQNNNISMSTPKYEGMTSAEMDEVLAKHFSKITTNSTVIDKNGFNTYISNGNSKTIRNQSRNSGIGFSI